MVDAAAVNEAGVPSETGEPIVGAIGDATGLTPGLAAAVGVAGNATLVGIGAGVFVGVAGAESPPQAPSKVAIRRTASSALHRRLAFVRKRVPHQLGRFD